jgi:hypothetical protein
VDESPPSVAAADSPLYLVEAFLPRSRAHEAAAAGRRARRAAEQLAGEGVPVRYVRTTFLPGDETCFHVFEAGSAEAVAQLVGRAELGHVRIVPAVDASPGGRPAS